MAKKKTAPTQTTITLPPATNPHNVESVYCNVMEMTASPLDVRLLFSEIINEGAQGVRVERRANVVMSLPHFKAMLGVLAQNMVVIETAQVAANEKKTG